MVTKKWDVVPIGDLLGNISKKRDSGELPKTEIQHVQPVKEEILENGNAQKSIAAKTEKQKTVQTEKRGGRPSVKLDGIEYIKISPRIPKPLKQRTENAMTFELFVDEQGRAVKTLDEIVALALCRLLDSVK